MWGAPSAVAALGRVSAKGSSPPGRSPLPIGPRVMNTSVTLPLSWESSNPECFAEVDAAAPAYPRSAMGSVGITVARCDSVGTTTSSRG